MPKRPAHENDAIPRVAPKWLKHDRQVSDSNRQRHLAKWLAGQALRPLSLQILFIIHRTEGVQSLVNYSSLADCSNWVLTDTVLKTVLFDWLTQILTVIGTQIRLILP